MTLPAIPDLPIPPLGFDIPTLIHPPLVHFAIVLPVVILVLEIYNFFVRRRSISALSFILLMVTIAIFVGAWLTGKVDGKNTFDLLTAEGKDVLKEHKLIGTYLVYGSGLLLLFKIFAVSFKGWKSTFLYILLLIGFVAGTLYQGKEGGELVYEQGANNARVQALSDELFDLKDEMEDLKAEKKEAAPAAEEKPAAEETPKTEAVPQKSEEKTVEPKQEEEPAASEAPKAEEPAEKSEEKTVEPKKEETPASETETKSEETPEASEQKEEAPAAAEESHEKGETTTESNATHE